MIPATFRSHFDMTERERFVYQENRIRLMVERGCKCEVCGKPLHLGNLQLAHRIPKAKSYLKQCGKEVIHHPLNLATVCSLKCNDAVLLDPKTHPIEAAELVEKIREKLGIPSKVKSRDIPSREDA